MIACIIRIISKFLSRKIDIKWYLRKPIKNKLKSTLNTFKIYPKFANSLTYLFSSWLSANRNEKKQDETSSSVNRMTLDWHTKKQWKSWENNRLPLKKFQIKSEMLYNKPINQQCKWMSHSFKISSSNKVSVYFSFSTLSYFVKLKVINIFCVNLLIPLF